jgi:hypothetical protein
MKEQRVPANAVELAPGARTRDGRHRSSADDRWGVEDSADACREVERGEINDQPPGKLPPAADD